MPVDLNPTNESPMLNGPGQIDMKAYRYKYDGPEIYPPVPEVDAFVPPPKAITQAHNHFWIDTEYISIPKSIIWGLYPQPSRTHTPGGHGSYLLKLPPSYQEGETRYPILIWLHGGMQSQRDAVWALEYYGRKMEEGKMPQTIIVAPQALPKGRYIDNFDGSRPIASVIAKDLIKHLDGKYRTIPHRSARWVEGFSMGGYGTLHLSFTFPEIFGAASAIAPACLPKITDEMPPVVLDTFDMSQDFYNVTHPYHLVAANIDRIKATGQKVRVFTGEQDIRLTAAISRLIKRFDEVGLKYEHRETPRAAHVYSHILAGAGSWVTDWWTEVAQSVVRNKFTDN